MGVFYNFLVDLFVFDIKFNQLQIIGVAICMTFSITAAIYKIRVLKETEVESLEKDQDQSDNYVSANKVEVSNK